jgi:hypothetical protein
VDEDDRPGDGDLIQLVDWKTIRSSGLVISHMSIVKAEGPHLVIPGWMPYQDPEDGHWVPPPRAPRPAPRDTIPPAVLMSPRPEQFQVGHRYWIAPIGNALEQVLFWPDDSSAVARVLDEGVEQNAYAWRPKSWKTSYITGVFDETDPPGSRIRLWRFGNLRWERHFEGALLYWYLQEAENQITPQYWPGVERAGLILQIEVRAHLDSANVYGAPARTWIIDHMLQPDSGRLLASRLRMDSSSDAECFYERYDKQGRVVYQRIHDALPSGGKAVGSKSEAWVRRVERWLDPKTGRIKRTVVRRPVEKKGSEGPYVNYVRVDRERGLAAGPVGLSGR